MRVYVKTAVPRSERVRVLQELLQVPLAELAAMNHVQAEHRIEDTVRRVRSDGGNDASPQIGTAVVCASRGSALAMTQARIVASKLAQLGIASTILNVTTTGDRVQDRSLVAIGAESLFVKELETALRDGRADYAVHSCKDLPSSLPADMRLAAISQRDDPRDVFCSERYARLRDLPPGARVGTSSLRRRAQLAALRSDLQYVDIRGNVDTRLRKLRDGAYDAIVVAAAGLSRLAMRATHTVPFDLDEVVPAAGQGALAVEVLRERTQLERQLHAAVNDATSERAVMCERAALRGLQGGCQAPIGVHAQYRSGHLNVLAAVAAADGTALLRESMQAHVETIEDAEALGTAAADKLLAEGARGVLARSPRPQPLPLAGMLVALARAQERSGRLGAALRADGAEVIDVRELGQRVPDVIVLPSSASVGAAAAYLQRIHRYAQRPVVATMGPASSAAAHAAGFTADVVAPESEVDALVGAVRAHMIAKEQRGS